MESEVREAKILDRHTTTCSQISIEKQGSLAHVVAHSGLTSPLVILPPPTPPHPSEPMQQFIHIMPTYRIGLIQD